MVVAGCWLAISGRHKHRFLDPYHSLQYLEFDMRDARIVVTTVGTEEEANRIAEALLDRRQSACVNVFPGVRSFFRWKGEVCREGELLLMIKTVESRLDAVKATIREFHSYELPEFVVYEIAGGDEEFLRWIRESVGEEGGG